MSTLPLNQAEAVQIGSSCFSFTALNSKLVYFSNLEACDFHDEGDPPGNAAAGRQFRRKRGSPQESARGVRHRPLDAQAGREQIPRRGGGVGLMVGEMAETAKRLLASGMSGSKAGPKRP